jgi:hypothetical protein
MTQTQMVRKAPKRKMKKAEGRVEPQLKVAEDIISSLKRVHMRVKKY